MNLFKNSGLKGPYIIIVNQPKTAAHMLFGASTQVEAVNIFLGQVKSGNQVVGIAKLMDVSVMIQEPHSNVDQLFLIAEQDGQLVDYVGWDEGDQVALLDMFLKYIERPKVNIRMVDNKRFRRMAGEQ
jgi:hypothetical protein